MPFKSKAQMRKFGQLLSEGKISKKTFDEFSHATDTKRLPERASKKKKVPEGKIKIKYI